MFCYLSRMQLSDFKIHQNLLPLLQKNYQNTNKESLARASLETDSITEFIRLEEETCLLDWRNKKKEVEQLESGETEKWIFWVTPVENKKQWAPIAIYHVNLLNADQDKLRHLRAYTLVF
jgi:hypothetical protein